MKVCVGSGVYECVCVCGWVCVGGDKCRKSRRLSRTTILQQLQNSRKASNLKHG